MTLSTAEPRELIHYRNINSHGYLREDGLWDIETHMVDTKNAVATLIGRGKVDIGEPIHDIILRVTIDDNLVIKKVETSTDRAPMDACREVNPWYSKLVGEKIEAGWRNKVKSLFAGQSGCTHINELLNVMAATAFQTVYPWFLQQKLAQQSDKLVFAEVVKHMLNSCHGFSEKIQVIKQHIPDKKNQSI